MKAFIQILFFIILSSFGGFLLGQESAEDIVIGKEFTMSSKILDQDRPYQVYFPRSYQNSQKKYPVIYLLDGRGNFLHTVGAVHFLSGNSKIPEMIVVGILNTDDRTRDLTPPLNQDAKQFPNAGGADNMIAFIETELIPEIERKFRVEKYRTLIGHSYGGLFVNHTFIHKPQLFDSYISISPSLWWDNQDLVENQVDSFFYQYPEIKGHFFMTMGDEGGTMLGGAMKFAAFLEENAPESFKWDFVRMEEENHGSIPYRSIYRGLEFIFHDWSLVNQRERFSDLGIASMNQWENEVKAIYGLEPEWKTWIFETVGNELKRKENNEEAILLYEKALTVFPGDFNFKIKLAERLIQQGKKRKAEKLLNEVLLTFPKNMQVLAMLKKIGKDVSADLPTMVYTNKQLKAIAGKYVLDSGDVVNFVHKNSKLHVDVPGFINNEELIPMANHKFFLTSQNSTIQFQFEEGEVKSILVKSPDGTMTGEKI